MNNKLLLSTLDSLVESKLGFSLMTSDSQLDMQNISTILKESNGLTENLNVNSINKITVGSAQTGELALGCNGNELTVYVPDAMQEQIRFTVEFVFSEFDKINDAISRLAKEFNIDRIGVIDNAERELKNARYHYTKLSAETINSCKVDVGNSLEQLKLTMRNAINTINNVPTDRKARLFKTKVNDVLEMEQTARMSCFNIIKGCKIYAEISMMLDEKHAALSRIEDIIDFFGSFSRHELERVEGWNKSKDEFWLEGFYDQKISLKETYGDLKMSSDQYTILVR